MRRGIKTFVLGTALSITVIGCSNDNEPVGPLSGVDMNNVPTVEVALAKRRAAEDLMGKACVDQIEKRNYTNLDQAVQEILRISDKPCGDTLGEVNHNVVVMRTHDAEVAFAEDKARH